MLVFNMTTHYKLIFLEAMGRGEIARLMFKVAGIEFEDFRVSFADWPEYRKTIRHGFVPVLEVNGERIIQSYALSRYIGRIAGFYDGTNWEKAWIDSICETITDYERDIDRLWRPEETAETKAWLKKRYVEVKIPKIYGILETFLKENNNGDGFFVGGKISMADFVVFVFVDVSVKTHYEGHDEPSAEDFPKLAAHTKRMKEYPGIKEWMKVRPVTQY